MFDDVLFDVNDALFKVDAVDALFNANDVLIVMLMP